MPFFFVLFLDRKPCFFACAFFVKTIRFSEVFFLPKILGREGGGGRILGCALTPRWLELDLRCCMAKRTPKKKVKREGAGSAWAETCHLAGHWLQSLAGKEIQLDSASETPSYGSCQVCLRHWRWLLSPQNKLRERSLS